MELKELEEGYDFEVHEEKEEDAKEGDTKEDMVEDTGSGVQLSVSVNSKCLIYRYIIFMFNSLFKQYL